LGQAGKESRTAAKTALFVGALGVVFGDIGTSPLYTVKTVFSPDDPHPVPETLTTIEGIVSLIFWSVTLIVTCKYVLAVMRADNNGEGGIMALISLVTRTERDSKTRTPFILAAVGVFGASLFFGDSMITPAISVLSAVEGMEVVEPSLDHLVLPITAAIIVGLFLGQRHGTEKVGRLFGPVMIVWFLTLAAMGIHGIALHPQILEALSPHHAIEFIGDDPSKAFFSLGAVVLAITGAEALFADMGHFGRSAITRAWLLLVFPALILNYLGQGALLVDSGPGTISSPFFELVPDALTIPLVLLATMAAVIASQAVISGAFSIATQAVQLGYLPRLGIVRTSAKEYGQVYVPWINWALMGAVLVLIFAFRSSSRLAFAYGVAVTGTFIATTLLFSYLAHRRWKKPLWLVAPLAAMVLTIECLFLASNLIKILHGAWLPLVIGIGLFTVMTTWQKGRQAVVARREKAEGGLEDFIRELHAAKPPIIRTPGTAVFLSRGADTAPLAMRATVKHNGSLHENVIVLSVDIEPIPRVPAKRRLELDDLGHSEDGIHFARVHYGYMQQTNVPHAVKLVEKAVDEVKFDPAHASYFLTDVELEPDDSKGMSRWRKELFLATASIASDPTEYFHLPSDRTVILGSRLEF
jgi:KUP system potassium uptake protein